MPDYSAFGLTIHAAFACPELHPAPSASGSRDVEMLTGSVPSSLPRPSLRGACFQRDASRLLLHVPGIAAYLVEDGTRVTIAAQASADPATVRALLFDSVTGALLQQRGIGAFLGFSMVHEGSAVLVLKARGLLGSSTLAAILGRRGRRILADGLAAVRLDDAGRAWALPGLACQYLRDDIVDALGLRPRVRVALPSSTGFLGLDTGSARAEQALPVSHVFVLEDRAPLGATPVDDPSTRAALFFGTAHHALLAERDPLPVVRALARHAEATRLWTGGEDWDPRRVAAQIEARLTS